MSMLGCYQFRATRNSELFVDEEEVKKSAHCSAGRVASTAFRQRGTAGGGRQLSSAHVGFFTGATGSFP